MTEANDSQLHLQRINVVHKKMAMCKKDDRQKSSFFIASKGVDLSSDIWPSRSIKGSLQDIKLMLDLLCHKRNSLITTVVDVAVLKKYLRLYLRGKCQKKISLLLGYYNNEIIINIKTPFPYG